MSNFHLTVVIEVHDDKSHPSNKMLQDIKQGFKDGWVVATQQGDALLELEELKNECKNDE